MRSTRELAKPNRPSVKRPTMKRITKGGKGGGGGKGPSGGGGSTDYSSLAGDASFE